jgi:hypothetical protein
VAILDALEFVPVAMVADYCETSSVDKGMISTPEGDGFRLLPT